MFGIKLYKTYNKVKYVLIKPKLKVMFGPMEGQPFYLPPFAVRLFDKHKYYNRETEEVEYEPNFLNKMRKWFPKFPSKIIRFRLPNFFTFRVINRDFASKWKYDNPCFEQKGYFSIVMFGIALTFYLEVPLDNEDKYYEDEYYEFIMEYLNGIDAGDLKESIKQMGTVTQHTKKWGERKYPAFRKEWLRPEWYKTYDIAVAEMERESNKDEDKEWILCSAIKRNYRREADGNPYYEGQNDILDIELGYRHHDIFRRFNVNDDKEIDCHMEAQGFYTSKGRFVGRKEAAKIAYNAGQIKHPVSTLFSENLY